MRSVLAIAAFAAALPALATSDGYLEWTQISFKAEPDWSVHIERQYDSQLEKHSHISVLEISRKGTAVEIPPFAIAQVKDPWLNGVKLLTVCCSDKVRLQIPAFHRGQGGELDQVLWELTITNGTFEKAALVPSKHEF